MQNPGDHSLVHSLLYIRPSANSEGGELIFIPSLFFKLSTDYISISVSPIIDPRDFVRRRLAKMGVGWCFVDFLKFVESYGDVIAVLFSAIDAVYCRSDMSYQAAVLLYIDSEIMPKPYSSLLPSKDSAMLRRLKLSKETLACVYRLIKS